LRIEIPTVQVERLAVTVGEQLGEIKGHVSATIQSGDTVHQASDIPAKSTLQ